MQLRRIDNSDLSLPPLTLGTWAFGNDAWWGHQDDKDSTQVLEAAVEAGITSIDTAPVYGKGHSEKVIGAFIKQRRLRKRIVLATKLGLSWEGRSVFHNLKQRRMLEELDESRRRLQTDYFDIYQVHWPDPDTPIGETAGVMYKFYQNGIIKTVGVSNYSVAQMKEFMKYSPLHTLQPEYSMFSRNIESEVVPFCLENKIAVLAYAPLYSGILTGKFFFESVKIPSDTNRRLKRDALEGPDAEINKAALSRLKTIAANYSKTLTQLAINWNFNQKGVTSAIVGMRRKQQLEDNLGSIGWEISPEDMARISEILREREAKLNR